MSKSKATLKLVTPPPENAVWRPSLRAWDVPDDDALALEWEARMKEAFRKPHQRVIVIYKVLSCSLAPEDKDELAERMAKADERKEQLETRIKGFTDQIKDLKKEIEAADDAIREARKDLRNGTVQRSVRVDQVMDFDTGLATYVRMDTREVLETRQLTDDERQTALQFGE